MHWILPGTRQEWNTLLPLHLQDGLLLLHPGHQSEDPGGHSKEEYIPITEEEEREEERRIPEKEINLFTLTQVIIITIIGITLTAGPQRCSERSCSV